MTQESEYEAVDSHSLEVFIHTVDRSTEDA